MHLIDDKSVNLTDLIELVENTQKSWAIHNLLGSQVDQFEANLPDLVVNVTHALLTFLVVLIATIGQRDCLNAEIKNEVEVVLNKRKKWHDNEGHSLACDCSKLESKTLATSSWNQCKTVFSTLRCIDDFFLVLTELFVSEALSIC